MRASLGLAAAASLAPLLIWQGRRVRRVVPKLPEADGPRAGVAGGEHLGRPIRLLILGDSSAAGVGVPMQHDALAGRLTARLAADLRRPLAWRVVARTGVDTRGALALLDAEPAEPFDVAVVALGVNDVTAMRPASRWLADVARLNARLLERHRLRRVVWSGLPPMHRFPALPQPLRGVMGLHARALDAELGRWVAARPPGLRPRTTHVPMPAMTDSSLVASDGFHPGAGAYAVWADALAPHLARRPR